MKKGKKIYITSILLDQKLITQDQLDRAVELQKKSDKKIGQILIDLGFIKEDQLLNVLSTQLDIPFVDLNIYPLKPELVKLLPEFYSRHFRAIILSQSNDRYQIGMVDPLDLIAQDEIEQILKCKIDLSLIREDDLLFALDTIYRRADEISQYAETLSAELKPNALDIFGQTEDFTSEDMPVVNLLRSIFEDAVQINASDIHIEPDENVLRIRLRVDGVLQEQLVDQTSISQALVQRIKLIAGLNIAEKRLPQDGRFSIDVKGRILDVRVSTIPVQYGESLVMRLLNQKASILQLDQIGMPEKVLEYFHRSIFSSYGLLLIVGPTGSGKTTTLYAALNQLNDPESKIITVEDPVEYRLPRINQIQVNSKINLTFATVLRSILRQDPDIIMVGEIRDHDTVEIAIRAAMTGHLVLATLHTNDSISCVTRLLDMGAESYLVASVLRGVLAQRLVRQICVHCKVDDPLTAHEKTWLSAIDHETYSKAHYKHGTGCTYCHQTGYQGRLGVFEMLPITDELAEDLRQANISAFQQHATSQPVYRSLLLSGLDLAAQGLTTISEIIRMAGEV